MDNGSVSAGIYEKIDISVNTKPWKKETALYIGPSSSAKLSENHAATI
jgi:hypothetical protein